jgi:hypothetical protein
LQCTRKALGGRPERSTHTSGSIFRKSERELLHTVREIILKSGNKLIEKDFNLEPKTEAQKCEKRS